MALISHKPLLTHMHKRRVMVHYNVDERRATENATKSPWFL